MSLLSLGGIRNWAYGLFGTLVLSTLWVTSLALLSARPNATALLTDAGAQVLNPFLVAHGTGLTPATYSTLQKSNSAQPLALPFLNPNAVKLAPGEIAGKSYDEVVRATYGHVAVAYYDGGGLGALFILPSELAGALPNFALFNPDSVPLAPGGPSASQLPPFLQPLFVFTGLTPATFTAAGNQRLLSLLPWFWLATVVLGAAAVLLNRSEKKLAGLAHGVLHSTWPIVGVLLGLWGASLIYKATFAPYTGILGEVSRAFLPIYGTACALGLIGVFLTQMLPALRKRQQAKATAPAMAGVPAGNVGSMGAGGAGGAEGGAAPGAGVPFPPAGDAGPFGGPSTGNP